MDEREGLRSIAQELVAEAARVLVAVRGVAAQAARAEAARDYAQAALDLVPQLEADDSNYPLIQLLAWASSELQIAKDPTKALRARQVVAGGFVFSGYWGKWSRGLAVAHPVGRYIEVNLTPKNDWGWSYDVIKIRIRAHSTPLDPAKGDIFVMDLPPSIRTLMTAHLGAELTNRLLTEDFVSQVDWALYRQLSGQGPGLEEIRRRD